MLPRKASRCLSLLVLLGGALMTSSCENAQVGVGLGFTAVSPWGPTTVMATTPVGWYGGPHWYP